jgi:hypothetical protein
MFMTSEPANMQAMLATQFSVRQHDDTWSYVVEACGLATELDETLPRENDSS